MGVGDFSSPSFGARSFGPVPSVAWAGMPVLGNRLYWLLLPQVGFQFLAQEFACAMEPRLHRCLSKP